MTERQKAERELLKNMPEHVRKLHHEARVHERNKKRVVWKRNQQLAAAADFSR